MGKNNNRLRLATTAGRKLLFFFTLNIKPILTPVVVALFKPRRMPQLF